MTTLPTPQPQPQPPAYLVDLVERVIADDRGADHAERRPAPRELAGFIVREVMAHDPRYRQ